jgi:hypothetical protein
MYPNLNYLQLHYDGSVPGHPQHYRVTPVEGVDLLMRVQYNPANGSFLAQCAETGTVVERMGKLFEQIRSEQGLMLKMIKAQRRLIQYNGHYIALLLGQITEDEFENISKELAYDPRNIDEHELAYQIRCLHALTGLDYSASDFADIFECDENTVIRSLTHVPETRCRLSTGEET